MPSKVVLVLTKVNFVMSVPTICLQKPLFNLQNRMMALDILQQLKKPIHSKDLEKQAGLIFFISNCGLSLNNNQKRTK